MDWDGLVRWMDDFDGGDGLGQKDWDGLDRWMNWYGRLDSDGGMDLDRMIAID